MYIVHQVMLVNKPLLLLGQIQVTHVHQVMLVNKSLLLLGQIQVTHVHQAILVNKPLLLHDQIQVTHVHCTSSHVGKQIFTIARSNTGNSCTLYIKSCC